MPGLQIAGNPLTEVTRETAKIGCTKVTRAEAVALLAEMDKAPARDDFDIGKMPCMDPEFFNFFIRHEGSGWVSVNMRRDGWDRLHDNATGYGNHAAFFCLEIPRAEKLLKFLAENLGFVAYKLAPK
jgi:hypothetical protein